MARHRTAAPGALGVAILLWSCALALAGGPPEGSRFQFTDVAAQAGLTRPLLAGRPGKDHLLDSAGAGAAFLDFDRDGRLDVFLPNGWRLDGARIAERGKHALYRGLPDGTFKDVTDEAGVAGEGEWGAGAFVADYDGDGWPDILVTTFGRNLLYRNLARGGDRHHITRRDEGASVTVGAVVEVTGTDVSVGVNVDSGMSAGSVSGSTSS